MTKRLLAVPAALLAVAVIAGCGGSSAPSSQPSMSPTTSASPTGTAPADPAAAKAEITANWEKFFNANTPRSETVKLLEDGDQLGAALQTAEKERQSTGFNQKAKVKSIQFQSATSATVHFDLLNGSQVVLPNSTGQAVYADGMWKVSKQTFCTLVTLGNNGKAPQGC